MSGNVKAASYRKLGGFPLVQMVSRRWILATFLVVAGMALTIRLGIWQLDRLEQRRAFNARVQAQLDQPVLELSSATMSADLLSMEYRSVTVLGEYDFSQQVGLRNQVWDNEPGVRLLTPLRIAGTDQFVLVDRGWVPGIYPSDQEWRMYDEPGIVRVNGMIRASQSQPDFGRRTDPIPAPGDESLRLWYFANVDAIGAQISGSFLPVYVQMAPNPDQTRLPHSSLPELELIEGPHLGYALQWFSFAALLGLGFPYFVRKREMGKR